MSRIIYGVWNGEKIDNRLGGEAAAGLTLTGMEEFEAGNALEALVANKGFLVFNPEVSLASVLADYYRTVRKNSCGRCTPCRTASILIDEAFEKLLLGTEDIDWEAVLAAACQMRETSLCGIGKTSGEALIGALTHFKEVLLNSRFGKTPSSYGVVTANCIEACPEHVNIPRYLDYVRDGENALAEAVVLKHYPLVATCGRVCVRPCEKACRRKALEGALAIKDVKRYIVESNKAPIASLFEAHIDSTKPAVAVVGAGPAGLNCAYHLLEKGYPVDLFDADTEAGGMALRGIPPYRLPKPILKDETDAVKSLGGRFFFGQKLGRDMTVDSLKAKYRAVFLGIGCAKGAFLGLPEEDTTLEGYRNGIDFLLEIQEAVQAGKQPKLKGDIAIVGCGNVAMDCCRSARRVTDGKVHLIYRRSLQEAPADREEIDAAIEEGVEFHFLTNPVAILSENHRVTGVKLTKMALTVPDERGRRGVEPISGSEFNLACDILVAAIGQKIETEVLGESSQISLGRRGNFTVDASQMTDDVGVFAGGDCATGPSTLVNALAQGERAATSIAAYLENRPMIHPRDRASALIGQLEVLADPVSPVKPKARFAIHPADAEKRSKNFEPADTGFCDAEARAEASRCMRCLRVVRFYTALPVV